MVVSDQHDVIIVGAGVAGLACARRLVAGGRTPLVLERSTAVGGRVKTDVVDGFLLDHGFQVLPLAYPEATAVLDYDGLAPRERSSAAPSSGQTVAFADSPIHATRPCAACALLPAVSSVFATALPF